ncbi:MAG: hypothetical protein AAF517_27785, partial [Planctomycetota bacterium]
RFRVQAIPDRKPKARIVEPGRITEEVSPNAKVTIRVTLEDDYGLRRAVLEGGFFPAQKDEKVAQSRALPGFDPLPAGELTEIPAGSEHLGTRECEVSILLDVSTLQTDSGEKPGPGSRFEYYVLAEDFGRTDNEGIGNIGESQVHLLEIVDEDTIRRSITSELMAVRDSLRQLMERQSAVRRSLDGLRETARLRGSLVKDDSRDIARNRQDQSRLRSSLERQAKEVENVLRRVETNAVGDEAWKRWIQGIGADISKLTTENSPAVEAQLTEIRKQLGTEGKADVALALEVSNGQREIERSLRRLVLDLEEYGDRSAVVELLRDVIRRQEAIRDGTLRFVTGSDEDAETPDPKKESR